MKIANMTSWELVDKMIYHMEKGDLTTAKIYQDEILSSTYNQIK